MKKLLISFIRAYQHTISPDTGGLTTRRYSCVFYPTCSQYTIEAIEKYGVGRGVVVGIRRILRCHPWQKDRIDPLV